MRMLNWTARKSVAKVVSRGMRMMLILMVEMRMAGISMVRMSMVGTSMVGISMAEDEYGEDEYRWVEGGDAYSNLGSGW